MFTQIQHIDDVLSSFEGRSEFTIGKRPGFVVIDYNYILPDTFDDPVRLEGRGIKFCSDTGKVLARPFHKFFNLNERDGSRFSDLPWDQPFIVQEKSDGSMIHPCIIDNRLVLMTRKGMSDVAVQAMKECEYDEESMRRLLSEGWTPIYEYVSPNNRIVVEYSRPELRLLAVRNNLTGRYVTGHGVRNVSSGDGAIDPIALIESTRVAKGEEGVVITWIDTGHKVKLKGEEYVQLHRAIDTMASEKRVLDVILEGKDDDLCSMISEERATRIRGYADKVHLRMAEIQKEISSIVSEHSNKTQKEFALMIQHDPNLMRYSSELFKLRANKLEVGEIGAHFISRHIKTQTELESHRSVLGIPALGTLVFNTGEV